MKVEELIQRPKWKTADGRELYIDEMGTSHIQNSLAMLHRKGYISEETLLFYIFGPEPNGEGAMDCYLREQREVFDAPVCPWIDLFEEELKRRGVK
jgi:hypothetical protein